MIELTKHIEILLLENDCVIVPDFGGFITHYQPARYEEDDGVFLPPTRTVGFNPQLTMNDGLLTQAYMQTYHTDFPDAARKIAFEVNKLKEVLYSEGVVELHGIGTLCYTIFNTYEFHPQANGVLSPTLYALDAFSIRPLLAKVVEEPLKAEEEVFSSFPQKEKKEFRITPQWLGNAVAVAVAFILFFALSSPVENTYIDKGNYASLGTDCLFDAIRSQSMATALPKQMAENVQQKKTSEVKPVVVKTEKVAVVSKDTDTPKVMEKPKVIETAIETPKVTKETPKVKAAPKAKAKEVSKTTSSKPETKKKYHIIVASLATSSDAKRMLQEYKQQGHNDASIKEGNGRFRISLCSFTDKAEANKKLNNLKKSDAFKGAWVLTSK